MLTVLLLLSLLTASSVVLENEYVRVTRNVAPCAQGAAGCGARVVVALGPVELMAAGRPRKMSRGDLVVFRPDERYTPPAAGEFLEVVIKPNHPPAPSPGVAIPPEKNAMLFDGTDFLVFEEKLDSGQTRARHSHGPRLVVVLNATRLQQWPDGQPEVFRAQVPDDVHFNPPVVHVVKTVGDRPLRNIVIEFKPARPGPG